MSALGESLVSAVAELDERKTDLLVGQMLALPEERENVLPGIWKGMEEVVRRYNSGSYFIADIIMAGALYSETVARAVKNGDRPPVRGKILCGVVQRDIHELGKNIIAGMLEYNGYEVTDLGGDVEPEMFAEAVRVLRPDTLILSGTLNSSIEPMRETLSLLSELGLRDGVRVLLGGACVTRGLCAELGADGYIENIIDCLRLCEGEL